jgi:hypothetical protein
MRQWRRRRREAYSLSQLQLLDSEENSSNQFWHSDNVKPGLTVLIPLVDMTATNGPTQLLPGSHRLIASADGTGALAAMAVSQWASALLISWVGGGGGGGGGGGSSPPPVRALCAANDAVVYDSRTLHRGLGNYSGSSSDSGGGAAQPPQPPQGRPSAVAAAAPPPQSRPVLILRFDRQETPPPGVRLLGTLLIRWSAGFLASSAAASHISPPAAAAGEVGEGAGGGAAGIAK